MKPRNLRIGVGLSLALLATAQPICVCAEENTAILQKAKFDANALRTRLRAQTNRFSALLEKFADDVIDRTTSPALRYTLTRWKTNAIPRLQEAMFRPDPRFAFIDTWAFVLQIEGSVNRPDNREQLKDYIASAHDTIGELKKEIEDIFSETFTGTNVAQVRGAVQAWATEHPLKVDGMVSRESTDSLFAKIVGRKSHGAFAAVDTVPETLSDLLSRMDVYTTFLPKQARWQAEIAAGEMLRQLPQTLAGTDRALKILNQAPGMISTEREVVLTELEAILDRERKAAVSDFEGVAQKEGKKLIDHLFNRLLETIALGTALLTAVAWIVTGRIRRKS